MNHLWENLSRNQRIGFLVGLQLIVIVVLVVCTQLALRPRENVFVDNANVTNIPDDEWRGIKSELWELIQNNVTGATEADVDDVVVREGTYKESYQNDITTAKFLIDIDSLKQTYVVTVSWSDEVELMDSLTIDCPKKEEMKFPETMCYGMYNNTKSLSLYLPYVVKSKYEGGAPNIYIEGNENNRRIDVMLSTCDTDALRSQAENYLNSIPVDLSEYTINYNVSEADARCNE